MAKGDLQIRIEAMDAPVARGFAIATIRRMREEEHAAKRPCPDLLAFLDDMEKKVPMCHDAYEILKLPIAQIAGWLREEDE